MKRLMERPFVLALGIMVLGVLGMGVFNAGACLYVDLSYLHASRMLNDAAARPPAPPAAPKPGG